MCVFVRVLSEQVFVEVNPLIIASPFGHNACLSARIADISLLRKANHEQCSKYGTYDCFLNKKITSGNLKSNRLYGGTGDVVVSVVVVVV